MFSIHIDIANIASIKMHAYILQYTDAVITFVYR